MNYQARALLDIITGVESAGSDPYNTVYGYGKYGSPDRPLTDLTLNEVYDFGRDTLIPNTKGTLSDPTLGTSAAGRYQFIGTTMMRLADNLGIDPETTRFTPEVQDALGLRLLEETGYEDYLNGDIDSVELKRRLGSEWEGIEKMPQSRFDSLLDDELGQYGSILEAGSGPGGGILYEDPSSASSSAPPPLGTAESVSILPVPAIGNTGSMQDYLASAFAPVPKEEFTFKDFLGSMAPMFMDIAGQPVTAQSMVMARRAKRNQDRERKRELKNQRLAALRTVAMQDAGMIKDAASFTRQTVDAATRRQWAVEDRDLAHARGVQRRQREIEHEGEVYARNRSDAFNDSLRLRGYQVEDRDISRGDRTRERREGRSWEVEDRDLGYEVRGNERQEGRTWQLEDRLNDRTERREEAQQRRDWEVEDRDFTFQKRAEEIQTRRGFEVEDRDLAMGTRMLEREEDRKNFIDDRELAHLRSLENRKTLRGYDIEDRDLARQRHEQDIKQARKWAEEDTEIARKRQIEDRDFRRSGQVEDRDLQYERAKEDRDIRYKRAAANRELERRRAIADRNQDRLWSVEDRDLRFEKAAADNRMRQEAYVEDRNVRRAWEKEDAAKLAEYNRWLNDPNRKHLQKFRDDRVKITAEWLFEEEPKIKHHIVDLADSNIIKDKIERGLISMPSPAEVVNVISREGIDYTLMNTLFTRNDEREAGVWLANAIYVEAMDRMKGGQGTGPYTDFDFQKALSPVIGRAAGDSMKFMNEHIGRIRRNVELWRERHTEVYGELPSWFYGDGPGMVNELYGNKGVNAMRGQGTTGGGGNSRPESLKRRF